MELLDTILGELGEKLKSDETLSKALAHIRCGIVYLRSKTLPGWEFYSWPDLVNRRKDIEEGRAGILRILSDGDLYIKEGVSIDEAYRYGFLIGNENVSPVGRPGDIPPVAFLKVWTWILKAYHDRCAERFEEAVASQMHKPSSAFVSNS